DDGNSFTTFREGRCRNGHVVQQAETHRPISGGVMTWGPNRTETELTLRSLESPNHLESRTDRELRRIPGGRSDMGVPIEISTTGHTEGLDRPPITLRMHEIENGIVSRDRFDRFECLPKTCGIDPVLDRLQSRRPFGMAIAG